MAFKQRLALHKDLILIGMDPRSFGARKGGSDILGPAVHFLTVSHGGRRAEGEGTFYEYWDGALGPGAGRNLHSSFGTWKRGVLFTRGAAGGIYEKHGRSGQLLYARPEGWLCNSFNDSGSLLCPANELHHLVVVPQTQSGFGNRVSCNYLSAIQPIKPSLALTMLPTFFPRTWASWILTNPSWCCSVPNAMTAYSVKLRPERDTSQSRNWRSV